MLPEMALQRLRHGFTRVGKDNLAAWNSGLEQSIDEGFVILITFNNDEVLGNTRNQIHIGKSFVPYVSDV